MNQIVHQFDKCITKSTETGTTNLCAEVNEGFESINQWNTEADARENTSMLSLRKWFGNVWYFITHCGANKDETLAKIRDVYPAALANSIDVINNELIAKYGVFGRKQWQYHGIQIGNAPALPEGIAEIMEGDCPIWPGKKVSETHRLVLMPETVNGKPLTLNSFSEIGQKKSFSSENGYRYIWNEIVKEIGDTPIGKSYWVLITKELIPESLGKSYDDLQTVLADLSGSSSSDYEAPLALEAAVFLLTQYFEGGTPLFANKYTRCQEKVDDEDLCVGDIYLAANLGGIEVRALTSEGIDALTGVAARRTF